MTAILKINPTRIFTFIVILLALSSCNDSADAQRAINVFMLGLLQVLNIAFLGSMALVFCVLSWTLGKHVFKILGWIFLVLFLVITVWALLEVNQERPKSGDIYLLFIIAFVIQFISLVFILKQPKIKSNPTNSSELDSIINDGDKLRNS